jgi:hypothetical protein
MNNDLFRLGNTNHNEGVSLTSDWTKHWRTSVTGNFFERDGQDAAKVLGSVALRLATAGALSVGGATAHDVGIIPRSEAFFDLDHGWQLSRNGLVRGLEIDYGQHWYWYTAARILALNTTSILYLPDDWTWSLRVTAARSQFAGTGTEWRPSGMVKLAFPITHPESRQLTGNAFFAAGTENFARVDQIGRFSSQTYGGGLRFEVTKRQNISGYAAYQKRSGLQTQTSFGLGYGTRF